MNKPLVGALVVTHGQLGRELVNIAEMIVGEFSHMQAVSIGWHDDVEESSQALARALKAIDEGKGVIILTDMFGGTPSNISIPFLEEDRVEIVTGVNLPMVIKLASQDGSESWQELVQAVQEQGKRHISVAGELLEH